MLQTRNIVRTYVRTKRFDLLLRLQTWSNGPEIGACYTA